MTRKHIVMYLPCRGDPAKGEVIAADLFPLESQQIAGLMEKFKFSGPSSVGTAGTGNG